MPGIKATRRVRRNPEPAGTPGALPAKPAPDYVGIATMMVGSTESLLVAGLGEKWRARDDERGMLVGATTDYLKAKNLPDIPPGVVLCFVVGAYVLQRINLDKLLKRPEKTVKGEGAEVSPAPLHRVP